jgi:hypothetical protein
LRKLIRWLWILALLVAAVGLLSGRLTIGISPWGNASTRVLDLFLAGIIGALVVGVYKRRMPALLISGLLAIACLVIDLAGFATTANPLYLPGMVIGVVGVAYVISEWRGCLDE